MKKSELRELIREQVRNIINEASVSQEAYTIHNITKCGQDAAQNFIDDNKLDGKKLAAYVRQHSNSKEKYDVRDIIAGTGVGANVGFKSRFLKQFKESVIKEAKEYSFTFDYNTDPDDIEYIENLLKKARVNAYAEKGTFDDEMVIIAGDAIELRKAKKAIEADGFQINEAVVSEANELTSYKIGDEVKFSNGEVWKVAKPGVKGDKIFLAPFNSIAKKGHISLPIEFTQDELKDTVTEADDPEAGESAPYGSGYSEVNEDAGMVIDVAMGVAVGLMGLWALVQSAPLVGRVFGNAAEYLAVKSEKKAKMALKNQRKETIAPIIAKFKNDNKLAAMYQSLPEYDAMGTNQITLKANNERRKQLTNIGNYIKSKLTPEELVYFIDISSILRTGDLK